MPKGEEQNLDYLAFMKIRHANLGCPQIPLKV